MIQLVFEVIGNGDMFKFEKGLPEDWAGILASSLGTANTFQSSGFALLCETCFGWIVGCGPTWSSAANRIEGAARQGYLKTISSSS